MSEHAKKALEKTFGLPTGQIESLTLVVTHEGKTETKVYPLRRKDDK